MGVLNKVSFVLLGDGSLYSYCAYMIENGTTGDLSGVGKYDNKNVINDMNIVVKVFTI